MNLDFINEKQQRLIASKESLVKNITSSLNASLMFSATWGVHEVYGCRKKCQRSGEEQTGNP